MQNNDQTSDSFEVVGEVQKVTRSRISISSLHEVSAEEEDIKRWRHSLVEGNHVGLFFIGRRLVGVRNIGSNYSIVHKQMPGGNLQVNSPMQVALPSCA